MESQKDHDKPENLVENPHQAEHEARSLEDMVDSNNSLEGYFAMNNVRDGEEKEAEKLREEQVKRQSGENQEKPRE